MKLARIFAFGMVGALALGHGAMAVENKTTVTTSAPTAPDSTDFASAAELASFKANPKSLLTANPIGGLQLTSVVKALALSDSDTVTNLIALSTSANPLQLAAIGLGLGQAAKLLKNSSNENDRQAAEVIRSKIDAIKIEALLNAFKSGLTGVAMTYGKVNAQSNQSGLAGTTGGGVGGAVNQNVTSTGSQGNTTSKSAPATNKSTGNTTESIPFSGASVTCTSSVSPTRVC